MPVDLSDVSFTTPTVSEVIALVLAFTYTVRRIFDLVIDPSFFELVGKAGYLVIIAGAGEDQFVCVSSVSLKMTFLLMRTTLLTKSHILNMIVISYLISYSFSDFTIIFPLFLACDFSAYVIQLKVLICLYRGNIPYNISCEILLLDITLIRDRFVR
jgi:hypothetical protein